MNKPIKALIISLTAAAVIAATVLGALAYLNATQVTLPTYSVTQVVQEAPEQNTELLSILQSVGAEYTSDLSIVYGELPYNARGSYVDSTITIGQIDDPAQKNRTIAHEYLHHVWYTVMTDADIEKLTIKLKALVVNDSAMQKRIQRYVEYGVFNDSELFSIYCTESSDRYILTVVEECGKYIDRSKLVLTR